jgi:RimJ/RimL family protein N-acetyltransferase
MYRRPSDEVTGPSIRETDLIAGCPVVADDLMEAADRVQPIANAARVPGEYETQVVLPNGRLLRLRSMRESDEEPLRTFCDGLSSRTRYLRFFSHVRLPDSVLRMLTRVDECRALALVAIVDTEGGGEIVGLGHLIAIDDCRMEVGLVVRDDWQRQRVGTELTRRMLQAAHARGFDRFVAYLAWDNIAIRGLLQRYGMIVSTTMNGGVSEITFVSCPAPEKAITPITR